MVESRKYPRIYILNCPSSKIYQIIQKDLVSSTLDSKPFFFTFATVCAVVPGAVGYVVMQLTSSTNQQLESDLRRNARPEILMMGKVNQDRLAEFLGELQRKDNTNDRYVAALKGETLTRKPYVRIQSVEKENIGEAAAVQQTDKEKK